ncbi:MAG: hypothetical protein ACKOX6_18305 [Bdellovibrio sp.]
MNKTYRNTRPRDPDLDQFAHFTIHVPKETAKVIKQISEERVLPISRVICYAIDNELDCPVPFNYETEFPDVISREFEYAEEAAKILKFLMIHFQKSGTGLDMLVLCRRDMGIPSKERFLLGFRELLEKKMLETFYPNNAKFRYAKTYKYYRPSRDYIEETMTKKRKAIRRINATLEKGPLNASFEEDKEEN